MCVCQSVGAWLWEIHKLQQVMKQGKASKSFISYTTLAATIQSAQGLEKFNHAKHMCKARWCTINWIHAWGKSEKNNVKKIHTQHLVNKTGPVRLLHITPTCWGTVRKHFIQKNSMERPQFGKRRWKINVLLKYVNIYCRCTVYVWIFKLCFKVWLFRS